MKTKRLNRDGWGFDLFPYYQLRADTGDFHGTVCLIRILSGESQYWDTPLAGKVRVCGGGMTWMTLVPDDREHIITAMYFPDGVPGGERKKYPDFADRRYPVSVWYADVTEGWSTDPDGVIRYRDKYLDYVFTPEGDSAECDRDELEEALKSGDITREQYDRALKDGEDIRNTYGRDIRATEKRFARIREWAEKQIADGHKPVFLYHGSRHKPDVIFPQKAEDGAADPQEKVRAFASIRDALPFALPVEGYPDDPDRAYAYNCDRGAAHIIRGIIDPEAVGYISCVSSAAFTRLDDWQWVSPVPVVPLRTVPIRAGDHFDRITWSKEAGRIQEKIYGQKVKMK